MNVHRSIGILTGLVLAAGVWVHQAGAQVSSADHLRCYVARDARNNRNYSVDLAPSMGQFAASNGCRIKAQARQLCIGTTKTNVTPTPFPDQGGSATGAFLCYNVRCPRQADVTLTVNDQLGGTRQVTARGRGGRLCTPVDSSPTTTIVPTTSTSTSTTLVSTTTTLATTTTVASTTTTTLGSPSPAFLSDD